MQTDSPEHEEVFSLVSVKIDNVTKLSQESNLSVINGWDSKVDVAVRGRRSDIAAYTSADVIASVDVGNVISNGVYTLTVNVVLPDGLQLVSCTPSTISVEVDKVSSKPVPVIPKIIEVKHDAECELGDPVAKKILAVRNDVKLLGTYIDKMPRITGPDNRIHCSFKSVGAATGRMASESPNMQNIPSKLHDIRHMFRATPELTEKIAENVHEVWAQIRIEQGWTYGSERSDILKQHPCLLPYEELPETEKVYDRKTALSTLKLISKLGFKICKE
jgi:ryanodine receptor 2